MVRRTYKEACKNHMEKGTITFPNGLRMNCEFFDGVVITDADKYGVCDYYARHDEDWSIPVSIKKNKGLTVNFAGTIVTFCELDFQGKDEVNIMYSSINYLEDLYD